MVTDSKVLQNYSEFILCLHSKDVLDTFSNEKFQYFKSKDCIWPNITIIKDYPEDSKEVERLINNIPDSTTLFIIETQGFQLPGAIKHLLINKWVNMVIKLDHIFDFEVGTSKINHINWDSISDVKSCQELISDNLFSSKKIDIQKWNLNSEASKAKLFVLRNETNEIVSTVIGFSGSEYFGVYFVCTKESEKGKGYAKNLMRYTLNYAIKEGYKECVLSSTKQGLSLYKNLGFNQLGNTLLIYKF